MKYLLCLFAWLLIASAFVSAQAVLNSSLIAFDSTNKSLLQQSSSTQRIRVPSAFLKVNVSSPFAFNSLNISYEQMTAYDVSIGLGVNFIPESTIPFWRHISNLSFIDAPPQISGFGISPELRFYLFQRRGGGLEGFYIQTYGHFGRYQVLDDNYEVVNYEFDFNEQSYNLAPFGINLTEGKMDVVGGGILFGKQWVIQIPVPYLSFMSIDWGIVGFGRNQVNIFGRLEAFDIEFPEALVGGDVEAINNQFLTNIQSQVLGFEGLKFGSVESMLVEKKEDGMWNIRTKIGMPEVRMYLKIGISLNHFCG